MPTYRLPLFALPIVIFPDEAAPLHIFEERYKQLLKECLESPLPKRFVIAHAAENSVDPVGTTVLVERVVKQYEDGRADIIVRGRERFRWTELISEKPYLEVVGTMLEEPVEPDIAGLETEVLTIYARLRELVSGRPSLEQGTERRVLSFVLGALGSIDVQVKRQLLALDSERARLQLLRSFFAEAIRTFEIRASTSQTVKSNGHIKH